MKKVKGCKVAAAIYTLVLFALHFVRLFDRHYWGDEGFTVLLSRMSVAEMIRETGADVHPPLYYLIVQIFTGMFGEAGWVYHLVSLLPYAVMLVLALTWMWKRFGGQVSVLFATFASLLTTSITYNVEVRMYTWGALFVLLSFLMLREILVMAENFDETGRTSAGKYYGYFVFFSLAAAYTHYYCLISVAFFYLVLLVPAFARKKQCLKPVLFAYVITIVGYLPWLGVLLQTFNKTKGDFWLAEIPTWKECLLYLFHSRLEIVWLVLFVAGGLWFIICRFKMSEKERNMAELLWITAGIVSVVGTIAVGIAVSHLFRPMFLCRYVYPVSVVAWLLFGCFISKCRWGNYVAILVSACLVFTCLPEYKEIFDKECSRAERLEMTLEALEGQVTAEDVIWSDITHVSWTVAECYFPQAEIRALDKDAMPMFEKEIVHWLVLKKSMKEDMKQQLVQQGFSCERVVKSGVLGNNKVHVYRMSGHQGE